MKIQEINVDPSIRQGPEIKRKKRIERKRVWPKFILILLFALSLLLLLALSPLGNIKSIQVSGLQQCNEKDILFTSGLHVGKNAFKLMWENPLGIPVFRFLTAEKHIQDRFAYVKKVNVKYSLNGTVFIHIEERTAAAVIPYQGTSLIVDREGYVLENAGENLELKIPVIRGIRLQHFEVGKPLASEDNENMERALEVIKAIRFSDEDDEYKISDRLDWIDVSSPRKLLLSVDSKIIANFGEFEEPSYMLNAFKVILKNLKEDDQGLVDFTSGPRPIFTPGGLIN